MKVKLVSYTSDAVDLLLRTKNTRLTSKGEKYDPSKLTEEEKQLELNYMLKTIQSSWEFVDYVFEITGVSRAFTHQLVRTRTGTYAQQSQRTVSMEGFEYVTPKGIKDSALVEEHYRYCMSEIDRMYKKMQVNEIPPQDARGILPTNICTNIIAKFNLRTMSDMAKKRLCTRTQGEYQDVFKAMKAEIVKVHPWAKKFLRVYCASCGVCQFPNYKECPLKPDIFNPETGTTWRETEGYVCPKNSISCSKLNGKYPATLDEIQAGFEEMGTFESAPKWKGNS